MLYSPLVRSFPKAYFSTSSSVCSSKSDGTAAVSKLARDSFLREYPPSKFNTVINVARRTIVHIIERIGRYSRAVREGLYFALPLVEKVVAVVDEREMVIKIDPQSAITKDNIQIGISGVVCLRILTPLQMYYNISKPLFAIVQLAESAMREQCGQLTLDQLLHERVRINDGVAHALAHTETQWGTRVLRYEVTDISPDHQVTKAMDLQAVAERERRQDVIKAEAERTSKMIRAEGEAFEVERAAKAHAEATVMRAEADASATIKAAEARAKAITFIALAMNEPMGIESVRVDLAKDYIRNIPELGKNGKLIMIPEDATDVNTMITKATSIASELLKK